MKQYLLLWQTKSIPKLEMACNSQKLEFCAWPEKKIDRDSPYKSIVVVFVADCFWKVAFRNTMYIDCIPFFTLFISVQLCRQALSMIVHFIYLGTGSLDLWCHLTQCFIYMNTGSLRQEGEGGKIVSQINFNLCLNESSTFCSFK